MTSKFQEASKLASKMQAERAALAQEVQQALRTRLVALGMQSAAAERVDFTLSEGGFTMRMETDQRREEATRIPIDKLWDDLKKQGGKHGSFKVQEKPYVISARTKADLIAGINAAIPPTQALAEEIQDSLRAELVVRGMNPDAAKRVDFVTVSDNKRVTVSMNTDQRREEVTRIPIDELWEGLIGQTGKHGSFKAQEMPYVILAANKTDLLRE